MRTLVLLLAAIALVACVGDTHSVKRPVQLSKRMMPSATAYVSMPPDGEHAGYVFPGSGAIVQKIVGDAFARHFPRVERAAAPQTLAQALAKAKELKASYLVAPAVLHWENWNTEISGRSDQVKVEIAVIEVATGQVIEHGLVGGTNGIPEYGTNHPKELLPMPVAQYVDSLFF
jgi:hypothetical protein